MVDCIQYLLYKYGFNYVLLGFINNERIEELFSIFQSLAGRNRYLDVLSYLYANQIILIRNIYHECENNDKRSISNK